MRSEEDTMEVEKKEKEDFVPIFIMGKRYEVPSSITIQKALEYAGYQLISGVADAGEGYAVPAEQSIDFQGVTRLKWVWPVRPLFNPTCI